MNQFLIILYQYVFLTGYCNDDHHRGSDPLNGILRGEITDFYLLSKAMDLQDMINWNTTMSCRDSKSFFGESSSDLIIDWNNLTIVKAGNNSEKVDLSVDEVCRDKNEEAVIIFSIRQNYSYAKHMCNLIGGSMYNPQCHADIENLPSILLRGNHLGEQNITELVNHCGNLFWIPIRQNGTKNATTGEYVWYQDVGNSLTQAVYTPWLFGQPNGGR